jgi:hypothetical protein
MPVATQSQRKPVQRLRVLLVNGFNGRHGAKYSVLTVNIRQLPESYNAVEFFLLQGAKRRPEIAPVLEQVKNWTGFQMRICYLIYSSAAPLCSESRLFD